MALQKLSTSVNKGASRSVKRIITLLCLIAGIAIMIIIMNNSMNSNIADVKLYSSEIEKSMTEKISFINTIADGVTSGSVDKDGYYSYVDTMVDAYDDVSAVYLVIYDGNTEYPDGYFTYMCGEWIPPTDFVVSDRAWFQGAMNTDDVYISDPYVDEQSGEICITLAKKIYSGGKAIGVAGLDMYMGDLVKLIESSYEGGNYVFLVAADGTILTHPNKNIALSVSKSTKISEALKGKYNAVANKTLKNKLIMDYSGGAKFAVGNKSAVTGWTIISVTSLTSDFIIILAVILIAIGLSFAISAIATKSLTSAVKPLFAPLEVLSENVSAISDGKLNYRFEVDEKSEEVNKLSLALNDTLSCLQQFIKQITETVTAISDKNLSFEIEGEYTGDYENIKNAMGNIINVLNSSFNDINKQASIVLEYSSNLSRTSEQVADSATNQSEAVMNASEEMNNLTNNMEKIAEITEKIKDNTSKTNESLVTGSKEMKELVAAMDEITSCFEDIATFVQEINEIASQTNLLSLNASIEAARAGEAGKGFAVVASEISSLANTSSQASTKISESISKSQAAVNKGREMVNSTSKTIEESVINSEASDSMVKEIVGFVETQKVSAVNISHNLNNISAIVETNAASAQENSAISIQLGDCAKSLMNSIGEFQLK